MRRRGGSLSGGEQGGGAGMKEKELKTYIWGEGEEERKVGGDCGEEGRTRKRRTLYLGKT